MLRFATAAVPVHVDASPSLDQATEENFVAHMTRAGKLINKLKRTSFIVIDQICQLKTNISDSDRIVIEDRLRHEYETALYDGNIPRRMVTPLASLLAHSTVVDVHVVVTRRGGSIVVYFLGITVKALHELAAMIASGFMHAIFAEILESLISTTVRVHVYAIIDDFKSRLLCLTSSQDKG